MVSRFYIESLRKKYLLTFVAVSIVTLVIALLSAYFIYNEQKNAKIKELELVGTRIEIILNESFGYVDQIFKVTADQLIDTDKFHDKRQIARVLNGKLLNNQISKNLFSWTLFDWIDHNNQVQVSSSVGVLDTPKDATHRLYAKLSNEEPWKIHFDKPSYGLSSGNWIIPVGMGITDLNGKFLGTLGVGFDITKFAKKITYEICNDEIRFAVIDTRFNKLALETNSKVRDDTQFPKIALDSSEGFTLDPIKFEGSSYYYYKKLNNIPYLILAGYESSFLKHLINRKVLPIVFTIILIGSVSIALLIIMRSLIYKPIILLAKVAGNIRDGKDASLPKFNSLELDLLSNQLLEIQNVKQELEHALKAKTRILNNLSHEIRTPIHAANGTAQLLNEMWDEIDDPERKRQVNIIAKNTARLTKFVGNILDLSKFSAGKMHIQFTKLDLIPLIDDLLEEFNELYLADKSVRIVLESSGYHSIIMEADEIRISQLLRNIIGNSIRYTAKGKITIKLLEAKLSNQKAIQIEIYDEGIGIPEAELSKIFEPFVQSSLTSNDSGGTGLGLAICKEIIEAHKGKIWAENNNPKITLPALHIISGGQAPSEKAASVSTTKTILLVDDEKSSHDMLMLSAMHYGGLNIISAYSGIEAIEILQSHDQKPDLIVLDLMLPGMNGIEFLKKIKENQIAENIPCLIQSGLDENSKEIQEAYTMGIKDIIVKPYDYHQLLSKITNLLKR